VKLAETRHAVGEPASVEVAYWGQARAWEWMRRRLYARQCKAPFGSELPKGAVSLQAVARFILSA